MAERESVEAADESRTCRSVIAAARALAPLIVGIAVARTGLIASSYSSYRSSDEGLFTDGATLLALVVLLIPFAIIAKSRKAIPKAWVSRIAVVSFVVEMLSASSIGLLHLFDVNNVALHLTLSIICMLSASSSMFYWLRRLRGTGTVVTVAYVFSALILSEFILFATALMGPAIGSIVAGLLALAQFPCKRISYRRTTPYSKDQLTAEKAFPGFDENTLKSRQLLVAMAVSIGLLGVVSGFLRGYPDGDAIPLGLITRIGYALLTVALSIAAIVLTVGKHQSTMPVGFFIILEALACLALVFYAAFPDILEVGALFTTTLNALMVGLAWYIVIAFMSFGWRDAYYYALAGWFVWLGARSLTRTVFLVTTGIVGNPAFAIAITAGLVVLSTQATLGLFLAIEREHVARAESGAAQKDAVASGTVMHIMGLDQETDLASLRQTSMKHSAEIMGKQFLLSEREVEVLALYALGFTQKKVAEELYITQSTAHEHIKRIYAKTGMHSRQEIIDYIKQYAS